VWGQRKITVDASDGVDYCAGMVGGGSGVPVSYLAVIGIRTQEKRHTESGLDLFSRVLKVS
jgi:hypothetical protein